MTIGRILSIIVCILLFTSFGFGQQKSTNDTKIASVFFIGEDEKNYEKLVEKYNTMLFAVCSNDMELAFDHWSVLLKDIIQNKELMAPSLTTLPVLPATKVLPLMMAPAAFVTFASPPTAE